MFKVCKDDANYFLLHDMLSKVVIFDEIIIYAGSFLKVQNSMVAKEGTLMSLCQEGGTQI